MNRRGVSMAEVLVSIFFVGIILGAVGVMVSRGSQVFSHQQAQENLEEGMVIALDLIRGEIHEAPPDRGTSDSIGLDPGRSRAPSPPARLSRPGPLELGPSGQRRHG